MTNVLNYKVLDFIHCTLRDVKIIHVNIGRGADAEQTYSRKQHSHVKATTQERQTTKQKGKISDHVMELI